MQNARHQLLTGARLAGDHHRQIRLGEPGEHAVDFLHRGRAADERQFLAFGFGGIPQHAFSGLGQRAPDDADQLVQVERFGKILIGALLRSRQRGHQRVLRAHHDNGEFGPELLDARDQFERVLVGHHHIGDDHVAFALTDPAPQGGGVARRARRISGACQCLIEHRANGAVVVSNENSAAGHELTF